MQELIKALAREGYSVKVSPTVEGEIEINILRIEHNVEEIKSSVCGDQSDNLAEILEEACSKLLDWYMIMD